MPTARSVAQWMTDQAVQHEQLLTATGLERKVLDAIIAGRWTPSPEQRRRIA